MKNVAYLHILAPGTVVGAGRWPEPLHAGLAPWKGVALSLTDPIAWRGTVLGDEPTQAQVYAHVQWCQQQGLLRNEQPVLWSFGTETKVRWERLSERAHRFSLKPYEEDLAMWENHTRLSRLNLQKAA